MGLITSLLLPAHGSSQRGRNPYMVQKTIDLTAQAISSFTSLKILIIVDEFLASTI